MRTIDLQTADGVIVRAPGFGILNGFGNTVPTDGTVGWATGATFIHTDGGSGTAFYINEGDQDSCDFNALETPDSGAFTIAELGDVADAFATRLLETGTYQSTAGGGILLSSTNNRPFTVVGDDGGVALTGDIRQILSRVLLTIDTGAVTLNAVRGQIKALNLIDVAASSVVAPVLGYLELAGTGARSLSGHVAGVRSALEEGASGTTTIAASSYYAGFEATLNSTRTYTTTGQMAAFMCNISGGTSVWPIGFLVDASSCTTGIEVAACAITGVLVSGAAVNCISVTGAGSTAGISISGAEAIGLRILTSTPTSGISIEAACATAGINITGAEAVGIQIATSTPVDGILISSACADGIQLSGANTANAINISGASTLNAITVSGTAGDTGLEISGTCANFAIDISAAQTAVGISVAGTCGTYGVAVTGACTTAGIGITGAEAIGMLIATSTPTIGVSITAACETAGISISGDQVLGILFHATAAATAAYAVTIPTGITLDKGLDINATSTGIVTSGLTMQGTGTFTTGITLSATAITTGIALSAGSMTDAILISGTTPVDGIHISSACLATGINLAGVCLVGLSVAASTTAISIGDATTGISFTGTVATGIDLSGGTLTTSIVLDSDARIVGLVELLMMGLNQAAVDQTFAWNDVTQTEAAAAFCKSYNHNNTKFVNISASAAQGEWTGAYQMFPDTEVENDACYFGRATPFGCMYFNVSATPATFGADSITWEYWDGDSWEALTIIWDKTDSTANDGLRPFQEDGHIFFSAPTDWASSTIDSQAAYWVRARCNATVNFTQVPLMDSVEHAIVTIDTGTKMPYAGTIGRGRFNFGTPSTGTADTKVILYNSTSGACSALSSLTKAKMDPIVADLALTVAKDDVIGFFVAVPDGGGTEYTNGDCELAVTRT